MIVPARQARRSAGMRVSPAAQRAGMTPPCHAPRAAVPRRQPRSPHAGPHPDALQQRRAVVSLDPASASAPTAPSARPHRGHACSASQAPRGHQIAGQPSAPTAATVAIGQRVLTGQYVLNDPVQRRTAALASHGGTRAMLVRYRSVCAITSHVSMSHASHGPPPLTSRAPLTSRVGRSWASPPSSSRYCAAWESPHRFPSSR